MDSTPSLLLLLLSLLASAAAESSPSFSPSNGNSKTFRPSVIVVIGIFAVMFTLAILLLLYAKLCHTHARAIFRPHITATPLPPCGASKTVIESLPFFRFAALKGSREGLECAVCLAAFDDADLLRLLPKCKHAFHIDCVDRWLEHRASCPLCRCFVDAADPSSSEGAIDLLEIELFVERVPSGRRSGGSSSRVRSFRKIGALLVDESGAESQHRFKHRIFVSEVVMKSRWSDVNSADLMSLNSEMLGALSSKRFDQIRGTETDGMVESHIVSVSESGGGGDDGDSRSLMAKPGKRCMSEMANLPRFRVSRESSGSGMGDETVRRAWLPIARRTLKWLTGVDRRLLEH